MINTLEQFLELECGIVTPKLLEEFEPHREFVETSLRRYFENPVSDWDIFTDLLWKYLPEPTFNS
jgi:hypothetical protein